MKPLKGTLLGIGLMVAGFGLSITSKLSWVINFGIIKSGTGDGTTELVWMTLGTLAIFAGGPMFLYYVQKIDS